jgi:hypothetical protein
VVSSCEPVDDAVVFTGIEGWRRHVGGPFFCNPSGHARQELVMGDEAMETSAGYGELSPELSLLAACTLWPRSDARSRAIAAAAAHPGIDWCRVAKAVERHRVAGFVLDGLAGAADTTVPPQLLASLRSRALADSRSNLGIVGEAVRLVRLLQAAGIPVLVLKGPGLMKLAYGDLAIRQTNDLDLLVPVEAIIQAGEICERAGYGRIQPPTKAGEAELAGWLRWRKDFIYRHAHSSLPLELHFRPAISARLSQAIDLWREPNEVVIQGDHTLPVPGLEALYPYLCLHGALCAWFRLKWLADIAALTADRSAVELEALHAAAVEKGVGRASGQALLLVEAVFRRPLPAALKRSIVADRRVTRLARFAFSVMCDPRLPAQAPLRSGRIELAHLLLIDDWRIRCEEIQAWLIDWTLVFSLKLPRGLWFLYPLLRGPIWLWRQLNRLRAPAR